MSILEHQENSMNLTRQINLSAQVGKNSHHDQGGALVIENVTVFAPGEFVGEGGRVVNISAEAVPATDWVNLLQGRPLIEGHADVHSANYGDLIRGTVKAVRVEGQEVIADIIIADKSLQDKVITGEMRSVSLSFIWNEELKKVDYINHLGVVKLGQVAEAVIHLEKKEKKNEGEQSKKVMKESTKANKPHTIEELSQKISVLEEAVAELQSTLHPNREESKENESGEERKYRLGVECVKLGLKADLDDQEGMAQALYSHKKKLVARYLPRSMGNANVSPNPNVNANPNSNMSANASELDILFRVALELQEQERVAQENTFMSIGLNRGGNKSSLGDILQEKAISGNRAMDGNDQ